MKRTTLTLALAASGAAVAGLVLSTGVASAGHTNTLLEATLDGRNEVNATAKDNRIQGDPDGKGEAYVFGIDGDATTLCYVLDVERIGELEQAPGNGRQAHIHEAAAGANGPVVAVLAWPQDGNAADCLTEGEAGKGLAVGQVAEILANPEDYYVNVHNAEYPAGALRGQLAAE